ncbi:hypothetical protein RHMOL_Rhmol11G0016100 [Rhododendron molle]|uniref:Uncharacterized protein n=1 Tax=Rhododendron molle TaxID=49168 RepID=A0ACC0LNN1_RHOML|nr:hypothetical protein RHMOL_Rhmol11G0016100 [Rhododendron molle]
MQPDNPIDFPRLPSRRCGYQSPLPTGFHRLLPGYPKDTHRIRYITYPSNE